VSDASPLTGRVLVTGAGGAVGRELVAMLVSAGALVRAAVHRRDDLVPEKDLDIDRVELDFATPASLLAAWPGTLPSACGFPESWAPVPPPSDWVRPGLATSPGLPPKKPLPPPIRPRIVKR